MHQDHIREIVAHFDGTRHGGIRWPDLTAITNEVIRDTFPDAMGVAVRGSVVAVTYATCPQCVAPLCHHEKDERDELFSSEQMDAMILAHVRGSRI